MGLNDTIRQQFDSLSPALQQVARLLLERPNEVVTASMRSVGARADLRPTTLVRFAQQLGYSGWPALKAALAEELGLGPQDSEAYGERARALVGRGRGSAAGHAQALLAALSAAQQQNLDSHARHNAAVLPRACSLLEKARTVHVAGYRACFPVAYSFVYLYRLMRNSVLLLDGSGGALEMQQRAMAAGDTLLVVSFAPYSREALLAVEAARAGGCRILAMSDSLSSPLALQAEENLLFDIRSPSFFPSAAAGTALAETLAALLASRAGKQVVERIERAEAQLFESGAYLRRPPSRRVD